MPYQYNCNKRCNYYREGWKNDKLSKDIMDTTTITELA